jgi:hypothetical protein
MSLVPASELAVAVKDQIFEALLDTNYFSVMDEDR